MTERQSHHHFILQLNPIAITRHWLKSRLLKMICLQPETETRDKIQHPFKATARRKTVPAREIQMELFIHVQVFGRQTLPWTKKVTTNKLHWYWNYFHWVPGLWQSGPWGRWIMQRVQHTQGLLLMPRNVPQQNAGVQHHWLESKQIHYLPFIQQLTTCLSDTRDTPFLLLFIFTLVSLTQLRCIL